LNEPVRCRFSAFSTRLDLVMPLKDADVSIGVTFTRSPSVSLARDVAVCGGLGHPPGS
jgi:hypothetical protein